MEINDATLHHVQGILVQVLSSDNTKRREAEKALNDMEDKPGFTLVILHLISALSRSDSPEYVATRLSASVLFKNAIKKRWQTEDDTPIPDSDRDNIKIHLVDLMCTTPRDVQQQLAEAVSIISKYDFPAKWQNLLPHLIERLGSDDINVIHGVMVTANSIMKRFRYVFKSDALYEELLYCLKGFQEPLTKLFVQGSAMLDAAGSNLESTKVVLEILRLTSRVFFSLNWQDIPEYFEDNTETWMPGFAKYLTYTNTNLENSGESSESGPIERLKAAIIENLVLYATKYEEMFTPYLPTFTEIIWQLLVHVKADPRYDILATVSIKFLTTVASKQMNVQLFTDEVLQQIVEQIVVPNLMATESDEELFEDNPLDYIRKDIEGSDQDTRRRCACELVRALLKFFAEKTSQLCVSYITAMLQQYESTGRQDWKAKDGALHLVLAVSVVSSSTTQGAGTLNSHVNILEIFNTHVLPELHDSNVNARPIVKADAIKLICTFRSHFPAAFLVELMPHLIRHLSSEHIVIQTYAALCIEKFLTVRDRDADASSSAMGLLSVPTGPLRLGRETVSPMLHALFSALFPVLDNEDLPENDYVMKCVMRVLSVCGTDITSVTELVLRHLTNALERVCRNPANPHFNHYLFECLALLVRSSCAPSSAVSAAQAAESTSKFEALLFPPFQSILQLDVVEFVPYVFQILAQLLSYRPTGSGLSEAYKGLFPPLLSPVLWTRKGNVPALTDLILAYVHQGIAEIVERNLLEGVLGVFQKLLASKANEVYAFKIICAVVRYCPQQTMTGYMPMVLQLMLMRMQENKTSQYCRLFVHFLCVVATSAIGPMFIYESLESIQAGMTGMIVEQILHPNAASFAMSDAAEVSRIVSGCSLFLCETPVANDSKSWILLAKSLLELIRKTPSATGERDDIFPDEEAEAREFDSAYSKLAYAQIIENTSDGTDDFSQARLKFARQLSALCAAHPSKYSGALQSSLDEDEKKVLGELLHTTGVTLN